MDTVNEIKIPFPTAVISEVIDTHNIDENKIIEINGKKCISFGHIDFTKAIESIEIATKNASQVIFGAVGVERTLNEFINSFFWSNSLDEKAQYFTRNILESSIMQYSFKKQLTIKIIKDYNLTDNKRINELEKMLADIMKWRNAFAHGSFEHDIKNGTKINFFSGSPKSIILSNEFWSNCLEVFNSVYVIIKTLRNALTIKKDTTSDELR